MEDARSQAHLTLRFDELAGGVREAESGLLVDAEDEREVERVGAPGNASSSCRSARSRSRVAVRLRVARVVRSSPTRPSPTAVS
jgi:hypothetical protein